MALIRNLRWSTIITMVPAILWIFSMYAAGAQSLINTTRNKRCTVGCLTCGVCGFPSGGGEQAPFASESVSFDVSYKRDTRRLDNIRYISRRSIGDDSRGERLYLSQCAMCHGQNGEGGRGPTLARSKLLHAPDDDALRNVIRNGIVGTGMPGTRLIEAELRELAAHVRKLGRVQTRVLAGDPSRGEEIYRTKGACDGCHMLSGNGGAFGPDLTGVGARRSPQHLRESLLDPGADFPRGFAWIRAVMREGRAVTGVRVNEDTFSIQLRDAAGTLHSFWKAELREFHKDLTISPMPSYRDRLTPGELDDLVAFLASLQEAK